MRALVIGAGSIGSRRARILKSLGVNVVVHDTDVGREKTLADELGTYPLRHINTLRLDHIDLVLICSPASDHLDAAITCAEQGCYLFIEKPLSNLPLDKDKLAKLTQTLQERGRWALMGQTYRSSMGFGLMASGNVS